MVGLTMGETVIRAASVVFGSWLLQFQPGRALNPGAPESRRPSSEKEKKKEGLKRGTVTLFLTSFSRPARLGSCLVSPEQSCRIALITSRNVAIIDKMFFLRIWTVRFISISSACKRKSTAWQFWHFGDTQLNYPPFRGHPRMALR